MNLKIFRLLATVLVLSLLLTNIIYFLISVWCHAQNGDDNVTSGSCLLLVLLRNGKKESFHEQ